MSLPWSRRLLPALVAAAVLPVSASAQQGRPFIDPALKRLLAPELKQRVAPSGRFDLLPTDAPLPMAGKLAVDRDARGRPQVGVFLTLTDASAIQRLRDRGATIATTIRQDDGRLVVGVRAPLDAADSLVRTAGVLAAYPVHVIKVKNDSVVHAIHADEVRQRYGAVWSGSAGQGVIIGIYDTGIDFTHPDFIDSNGRTRLLGVWDQRAAGTPPGFANFSYGSYCTQAMIQAVIAGNTTSCLETDTYGHGTHVAGTAAGDGSSVSSGSDAYQFAGVAPAADLLVVRGDPNGSFDEINIINGIAWIDSMSLRLHKPAVVNLSLGGQYGPRDGSTVVEKAIDAMARPGFVVVVAAGNEGSNANERTPSAFTYFHATQSLATGQTGSVTFTIPTYTPLTSKCSNGQTFDAWYGGSDQYDITIVRPDGSQITAAAGTTKEDDVSGGDVYIDNASTGPDSANGDKEVYAEITDCGPSGSKPAQGTWTVQLNARNITSGKAFHLWLDQNGGLGGAVYALGASGFDNRFTVGTPGTARTAITAAAFVSKVSWPTPTGTHQYVNPPAVGDLAPFSSGGPTRDGRAKPDIAAPGMGTMSTLSKGVPSSAVSGLILATDGLHWLLQGTSMATPAVTGAVALILQAKPQYSASDVRALLAASATQDGFTSRTYGNSGTARDWWGGGKLNVKAAILALGADPRAVASVIITTHADTLVRNATDQLAAVVANALGAAIDSTVSWSSSNPSVATVDNTGRVRAVASGSTWIRAAVGIHSDSAQVAVVTPSTLVVTGRSASPTQATLGRQGTKLPLLALTLKSSGYEAMNVTGLTFDVRGSDPGAQLVLVRDLDRSGTISSNEPQVASAPATLTAGQPTRVTLAPSGLTVGANDSVAVVVAVVLSGQSPNLSGFSATLVPEATHTLGVRSQAADQLGTGSAAVASSNATSTVLEQGETFAMSENPVRHGHVIFNFSEKPTLASIYSLSGRRVADLLRQMSTDGRVDWALTNDDGGKVANGIYLVVFNVGGQVIRQKLFIARP